LPLPTVELELELEELEELSLVPSTPDVDVDGIAKTSKASTAFLEPPSVSGESLSPSISLSVIVELDEFSDSASFLSSSVTASIFSIISSKLLLFLHLNQIVESSASQAPATAYNVYSSTIRI
jgi:hypothetical protein